MVDQDMLRQFVDTFTPDASGITPLLLRKAKVVGATRSGTTFTCDIQLAGDTTTIYGVKYLSSYTPMVDHIVQVLMAGPQLLVIGRVDAELRRPWAMARRTSSQFIAHATDTFVVWQESVASIGGAFGSDQYTAKRDGLHLVVGNLRWGPQGVAGNERHASIWRNRASGERFAGQTVRYGHDHASMAALIPMLVNHTVQIGVWHNTGVSTEILALFGWTTTLAALYLGDYT